MRDLLGGGGVPRPWAVDRKRISGTTYEKCAGQTLSITGGSVALASLYPFSLKLKGSLYKKHVLVTREKLGVGVTLNIILDFGSHWRYPYEETW